MEHHLDCWGVSCRGWEISEEDGRYLPSCEYNETIWNVSMNSCYKINSWICSLWVTNTWCKHWWVAASTLQQPSVSTTSIRVYIVIIASVNYMEIKALMSQMDGAKDVLRGDLFCNKERKWNVKLCTSLQNVSFSFMWVKLKSRVCKSHARPQRLWAWKETNSLSFDSSSTYERGGTQSLSRVMKHHISQILRFYLFLSDLTELYPPRLVGILFNSEHLGTVSTSVCMTGRLWDEYLFWFVIWHIKRSGVCDTRRFVTTALLALIKTGET